MTAPASDAHNILEEGEMMYGPEIDTALATFRKFREGGWSETDALLRAFEATAKWRSDNLEVLLRQRADALRVCNARLTVFEVRRIVIAIREALGKNATIPDWAAQEEALQEENTK